MAPRFISNWNGEDYIRTPEDDANEARERAWKTERNNQALREFLRRNPSGRVIPKSQ